MTHCEILKKSSTFSKILIDSHRYAVYNGDLASVRDEQGFEKSLISQHLTSNPYLKIILIYFKIFEKKVLTDQVSFTKVRPSSKTMVFASPRFRNGMRAGDLEPLG